MCCYSRVLLDGDARRKYLPRRAKGALHSGNVPIIDGEYPAEVQGLVQDLLAGREALLGEESGLYAIPSGLSHVQGLGHGAEVSSQAARRGGGDAQGHPSTLLVQLKELGGSGCRPYSAQGAGGMPALDIVAPADRQTQLAFDLEADEKGFQGFRPGGPDLLAQGHDCGDQRSAGMSDHGVVYVIVVQGMGHGAVDEGRGQAIGPHSGAEDGRCGTASSFGGKVQQYSRSLLRAAGYRHPQGVEEGPPALV